MMQLSQSTTVTVLVGPFLDATDGVTPETGLAGSMTVYLSKNGAASAARNSATAITHDRDGYYRVELDATDTNTAGILILHVSASGTHLPVRHEFVVGRVAVDVEQWNGSAVATPSVAGVPEVDITHVNGSTSIVSLWGYINGAYERSLAQGGSANTIQLNASTTLADDALIGRQVVITSGSGEGSVATILDYDSITKTATTTPWPAAAPDNTSYYLIEVTASPRLPDPSGVPSWPMTAAEGLALLVAHFRNKRDFDDQNTHRLYADDGVTVIGESTYTPGSTPVHGEWS